MRADINWVVNNWDFLSRRYVLRYKASTLHKFLNDTRLYCSGKFFGLDELRELNLQLAGYTQSGGRTLCLRPFVTAPMPEGIVGVYVDTSRYKFDAEGIITDFDSYEYPIFVFEK